MPLSKDALVFAGSTGCGKRSDRRKEPKCRSDQMVLGIGVDDLSWSTLLESPGFSGDEDWANASDLLSGLVETSLCCSPDKVSV